MKKALNKFTRTDWQVPRLELEYDWAWHLVHSDLYLLLYPPSIKPKQEKMLLWGSALVFQALHLLQFLHHLSCSLRILPAFGDILTAAFIILANIYFQLVSLLYKQTCNGRAAAMIVQLWGGLFTVQSAPALARFYSWVLWGARRSSVNWEGASLFANGPT